MGGAGFVAPGDATSACLGVGAVGADPGCGVATEAAGAELREGAGCGFGSGRGAEGRAAPCPGMGVLLVGVDDAIEAAGAPAGSCFVAGCGRTTRREVPFAGGVSTADGATCPLLARGALASPFMLPPPRASSNCCCKSSVAAAIFSQLASC